jgi:DNA mismatch endonuclease (patch repair protein)
VNGLDTLDPRERSERMSRVKGRDTGPELRVRRAVHAMGYRYRLHVGRLPGKPDLVLARHRLAIFVHGCFWHRHADPSCRLARLPKSRLEFWLPKLEANRERDTKQERTLRELGWRVAIIWECETRNAAKLDAAIKRALTSDAID